MNWLFIVVILILGLSIYRGYRKGFLRIAFSLVAWILMFAFVTWSSPYIAAYLTEHTTLADKIEKECETRLRSTGQEKVSETGTDAGQNTLEELGISLPESVLEKLQQQVTGTASEVIEQSGIYQQIANVLTTFIIKGISFFLALVLALILFALIQGVLGIVSEIPIIHGVNQGLGTVAGALYGMVFIWLGMFLIALCASSDVGRGLYSYIQENPLLTFLYQNNPILLLL